MRSRHLAGRVREALDDTPAVFLAGGRQTGKTTLAEMLVQEGRLRRYLSLDDPTVRSAAQADPAAFLAGLEGPVVLDEVQQAPALFPVLRTEIDRDRRPGRFLLTGSAHVMVVPQLAQALVGRVEVLTLWPLSQGEIEGVREGFIDALFESSLSSPSGAAENRGQLLERALRGGYPEVLDRASDRRAAWHRSYVDLLLRRDVRELAQVEGLGSLPRLVELLAARSATLLNFAELSRSAGIPQSSLKRYFALLEGLFLLVRIPGWASNRTKRLTRSPKLHFCDSGLLAHLLRFDPEIVRERPDAAGPLLESFVALELQKQIGWSRATCRLHHFRTASGREVDLVLENEHGRLVGVDVKSAASVTRADFRGLDTLAEIAGAAFHRGVVLYSGSEAVSFAERLSALPISALWSLGATPVERSRSRP